MYLYHVKSDNFQAMKKFFYTFLVCFSATAFAQKSSTVKFAVANNAIGTVSMFDANTQYVQSVKVYKNLAALPQNLKGFSEISDRGLVEVIFKKDFGTLDFLSAANLNEQFKLPKNQPVMIEGYEISASMNIFSDMISKMEVRTIDGKQMLSISAK